MYVSFYKYSFYISKSQNNAIENIWSQTLLTITIGLNTVIYRPDGQNNPNNLAYIGYSRLQ